MNKAYNKITWQNKPSTATPLNQTNLNEMSNALDTIDDRVIALDSGKVSSVTVTNTLQTGDTIATITVDGTATNIKSAQIEVDDTPSATSENPLQNKAIYEMLNNLLPEETAQGNPIAISDASGLNAKACSVDLLPIQDLHGYDSPWAGGAGKNKCDSSAIQQGTLSGVGQPNNSTTRIRTDYCKVFPSTKYTFSVPSGYLIVSLHGYENTTDDSVQRPGAFNRQTVTITTDSTINYLRFIIKKSDDSAIVPSDVTQAQLELGETATAFAPYSNICPISGRTQVSVTRTGVNQWDEVAEKGTINDSTGQNANNGLNQYTRSANYIRVFEGLTYYFKVTSSGKVYYYDAGKNYITYASISNGTTKTIPSGCCYIRFWINYSGAYNNDMSVNYPSTNTEYHAYQGETVTIQFGQTVYGGTLDATNGKLTIDKVYKVFNGGLDESWDTAQNAFYINTAFTDASSSFETNGTTCKCNMYAEENAISMSSQVPARSDFSFFNQKGAYYQRLWVKDSNYSSVDSFKTALTSQNLQIVYPLGTPIELTLTPEEISLLKGNNTLSTDGDNINLKYSADIKAWVENQLQS